MEDITDLDDNHTKRFCKGFEIKNFGECQDLYLKSDTFKVADFFEKFRKMYLEIYELDPAKNFSVPGLVWEAALKKTKLELELLTDLDMLITIEKSIRGAITLLRKCKELIINIWKIMIKIRNRHI